MGELWDWMSRAEATEDAHVTDFLEVPEWNPLIRQGPVVVLPGVIDWSYLVFLEAQTLARRSPRRAVDLYIELKWGRKPSAGFPKTAAQVKRVLDVTPPSLVIFDEKLGFTYGAKWPVVRCERLDKSRIIGARGQRADDQALMYFVEFKHLCQYPRYILATNTDMAETCSSGQLAAP